MIDGNVNENADRSAHGHRPTEHTIGAFTAKLREMVDRLQDDHEAPHRHEIWPLLAQAATLIDNMRPAVAWLKRQPGYQQNPIDPREYTFVAVADLLERYAAEHNEGKD